MIASMRNVDTDARGRELGLHGTAQFPVAIYDDDLTEAAFAWHWHDELELNVAVCGRARLSVGTETHTLEQGDGVFINAGALHRGENIGAGACLLHWTVFHPRLIGGSIDSILWQKYVQPLLDDVSRSGVCLRRGVKWQAEAVSAAERAYRAYEAEQTGYEFAVREALSHAVFLLSVHRPASPRMPSDKQLRDAARIKTMLQYIQQHYAEEITVAQIARSAIVSESECLRCFRALLGVTPIQYVKQYRVQKAAELLRTGTQKVTEIGTQCGFQGMSYFTRTFKRICGCTPTDYRKQMGVMHGE